MNTIIHLATTLACAAYAFYMTTQKSEAWEIALGWAVAGIGLAYAFWTIGAIKFDSSRRRELRDEEDD